MKYIEKDVTQARLKELGKEISKEYLQKRRHITTAELGPPTEITAVESNASSASNKPSEISEI